MLVLAIIEFGESRLVLKTGFHRLSSAKNILELVQE
jgi:hypothetical protein